VLLEFAALYAVFAAGVARSLDIFLAALNAQAAVVAHRDPRAFHADAALIAQPVVAAVDTVRTAVGTPLQIHFDHFAFRAPQIVRVDAVFADVLVPVKGGSHGAEAAVYLSAHLAYGVLFVCLRTIAAVTAEFAAGLAPVEHVIAAFIAVVAERDAAIQAGSIFVVFAVIDFARKTATAQLAVISPVKSAVHAYAPLSSYHFIAAVLADIVRAGAAARAVQGLRPVVDALPAKAAGVAVPVILVAVAAFAVIAHRLGAIFTQAEISVSAHMTVGAVFTDLYIAAIAGDAVIGTVASLNAPITVIAIVAVPDPFTLQICEAPTAALAVVVAGKGLYRHQQHDRQEKQKRGTKRQKTYPSLHGKV